MEYWVVLMLLFAVSSDFGFGLTKNFLCDIG